MRILASCLCLAATPTAFADELICTNSTGEIQYSAFDEEEGNHPKVRWTLARIPVTPVEAWISDRHTVLQKIDNPPMETIIYATQARLKTKSTPLPEGGELDAIDWKGWLLCEQTSFSTP